MEYLSYSNNTGICLTLYIGFASSIPIDRKERLQKAVFHCVWSSFKL